MNKQTDKKKEYTFRQGFTVKVVEVPGDVFEAMGETHICMRNVYELYHSSKHVGTYDTFNEAKEAGIKL